MLTATRGDTQRKGNTLFFINDINKSHCVYRIVVIRKQCEYHTYIIITNNYNTLNTVYVYNLYLTTITIIINTYIYMMSLYTCRD